MPAGRGGGGFIETTMTQCVIVAGLPRSGTSLVAGVLSNLGYWLGDEFLEPGPHNPKGTFNCAKLEEWCDSTFTDFPVSTAEHAISDESVASLRKLISERLARRVPFGMKCTRIWCAAPLLAELLTVPAKVVFTSRETSRAVRSWIDAFDADPTLTFNFYLRAEKSLEFFRQRNPWPSITVSFDDLIDAPSVQVNRIADFLGVPSTQEARNFPEPALRRF